ncbi:MAG: hypothetical protein AB7F89_06495 [Pirellulaceae bacterium]
MKRHFAALAAFGLIAMAAWLGSRSPDPAQATVPSPLQCIDQMFQAAAEGDVRRYLDCFDGPQRAELERSLAAESGTAAAASLQGTVSQLKGWAVLNPPPSDSTADLHELTVERVYAGRIDRQRMELRPTPQGWRIHRVESAQATQPAIAYGTPISEVPAGPSTNSASTPVSTGR